jgi:hypothetical protein
MPILPTPAATKYMATGQPNPPAPMIRTGRNKKLDVKGEIPVSI